MCLLFIPSTDARLWVWSPEFTRPVSRFRSNYPSKHEKPTKLEQTSNQSLGLNDQQEFHEYFEQTLSTRGTNLHNLMNRIFEAEQMQLLVFRKWSRQYFPWMSLGLRINSKIEPQRWQTHSRSFPFTFHRFSNWSSQTIKMVADGKLTPQTSIKRTLIFSTTFACGEFCKYYHDWG